MEKIKKFSRNKVLSIFLLLAITFSVVTVVFGTQANPGHNINTLGGVVAGDLLYGSGTDVVAALADIATGNALISGGVTPGLPAWGKIGLTTHVSGILPTANGGTGIAYFTAAGPTIARTYTFPDAAATVLTSNSAVTVAQGGTGLATLTTGNVILGAGASNVTFVSPATNGNVLTANGTTWVSQAPAGGGAPTGATYITQTADATLSAEQALSTLSTGYMKVANGTGVITSQAVPIPVSDGGTGATTLTANNVILGAGASAPTFVAPSTAGNLLQSNGTTWLSVTPSTASGLPKYNQSVTTPAAGFAADTYLVGSSITIASPSATLKVGSRYHLIFNVSKTAAGVATPILNVRFGTGGVVGDASKCALTWTAQTAATDTGTFEIWATFRTVGSGTTAVLQCAGQRRHGASITGLGTLVGETKVATSAGFDSTVANSILGVSVNGGASAAWTITNVNATLENIN